MSHHLLVTAWSLMLTTSIHPLFYKYNDKKVVAVFFSWEKYLGPKIVNQSHGHSAYIRF